MSSHTERDQGLKELSEQAELGKQTHQMLTTIAQGLSQNEVFQNWWIARFWSERTRAEHNQIYRGCYFEPNDRYGYFVEPTKHGNPHVYWSLDLRKYDLASTTNERSIASAHIGANYIINPKQTVLEYKGGFIHFEEDTEGKISGDPAFVKISEHFGEIYLPKRRKLFPLWGGR